MTVNTPDVFVTEQQFNEIKWTLSLNKIMKHETALLEQCYNSTKVTLLALAHKGNAVMRPIPQSPDSRVVVTLLPSTLFASVLHLTM